jgi:mevalonate pyrophosphate decarboxylase
VKAWGTGAASSSAGAAVRSTSLLAPRHGPKSTRNTALPSFENTPKKASEISSDAVFFEFIKWDQNDAFVCNHSNF